MPITRGVPIVDDVLAAIVLVLGSFVLALAAALLSRRRPLLRPVAVALGATLVIDVVRLALDVLLAGALLPYAGAARALFTLDVVLFCLWPAPLVALAWHALPRRSWWPPIAIFTAWGLLLALAYPSVHGPAMIAAQGVTRPLALLMVAEAALALHPRTPVLVLLGAAVRARTGAGVVAAFAGDMAGQILGPWLQPWPWPPPWGASRAVSALALLAAAVAIGAEWRRWRRGRTVLSSGAV